MILNLVNAFLVLGPFPSGWQPTKTDLCRPQQMLWTVESRGGRSGWFCLKDSLKGPTRLLVLQ